MPIPTLRRTLVALAAAAATAALAAASAHAAPPDRFDALVFSKTAGWRHDSIPAGQAAIRALGARHGFRVRVTEDASVFTPRALRDVEVVVFLNTTGTVLDAPQRRAIARYVTGGGFVGVHSAADTEDHWPFYGRLVGARFHVHPPQQAATLRTEDRGRAGGAGPAGARSTRRSATRPPSTSSGGSAAICSAGSGWPPASRRPTARRAVEVGRRVAAAPRGQRLHQV